MVQGYRGVNVNARDNEEFVGEMHMKDYIDVSNQENVAPVYFHISILLATSATRKDFNKHTDSRE